MLYSVKFIVFNHWKEGLCCFGCLFKLPEVWWATPDSVWCLRLSSYFWTLQIDIFVLTAHLEHQLLLCWFTALAFIFQLIRGTLRDIVLFPFWPEDILTLLTRELPVQCLQVWCLCMSELSLKAPQYTVPSGVATTTDDIFTVSCPARSWWWLCCDMWIYI